MMRTMMKRLISMSEDIDVRLEQQVAEFYQSLGIHQGPGDIQYRLILKVLSKNEGKVTEFSEIREYTDMFADKGSIGSKMKTIFQLEGLAEKVKRGGYTITDKGITASNFLKDTTAFYKKNKRMGEIIERMP
jgi:predicted transcriptional regulator